MGNGSSNRSNLVLSEVGVMSYEIKNAGDAVRWLTQPGIQVSAFGDDTTREAVNYLIKYVLKLYRLQRRVKNELLS